MNIDPIKRKQYRSLGHKLNPVVIIGENGLSPNLLAELERALNDHELIKIKCAATDRTVRAKVLADAKEKLGFAIIQTIGKIALIYKPCKTPNKKLSNLHRPVA